MNPKSSDEEGEMENNIEVEELGFLTNLSSLLDVNIEKIQSNHSNPAPPDSEDSEKNSDSGDESDDDESEEE